MTTKLDAPYTLLTIKGTLHAPFSEDALGGIDNPALDTDSSWIRAEDAGIGSSSNASLRRADQKTSRFGLKSYRLGSSGQRALSSDKASALNSRSFTTASIRLKKNEDLTSAIRVGRNPEEIKKGEQKLSHVAEKKILKIEQSRTRGGEKAKGRTQNSMIGATNPSIYQMEDPETLERASQEQTPLSTYSAKPEEDDDSSSAVLVDKSLGTKSRGETERSNIAKARKAWKRKQAKEKAANSVIGATNPSKDVTEDQETIERAPQNQARIRTYSAKPEEELPPHVRSQILKQTKSKIRKQKALVEGDPDFQNHPLSSTTHFKPRIEQAAGNVGRKSAREAETETASTIRYIEVDDAIHLTSPSKVDMQLAKPLTIRRHLAAPKTPHQDSEAPTVRYSAPDKTPRKAPFGEATTGPAEDAEMLTLRRYLAPARSTTAPNLGTYPEPDASSNESQSETESETRNSVINFLKEQDPWTSQNHPERTKRFRRLYQDLTKGTDEMPYVPAEGSPLIRYEATDKSQRLRDAYAMKQARDGFVIRKHGGPYVRVTKYGGGDSEIAMGQGREFSGEEERDVPAREDKRAVSAREYATGLHREYHSSMSDWE